jgi:leader peptidase (prepilin peptidase)/N-methyltransferase
VLIFGIVQLGKKMFGRLKLAFDKPVDWSVSQAEGAEEPMFRVAEHEEGWSNIFNRTTDRLIIRAASAKLDDRNFESVILTMSNDTVVVAPQAGGAPETIPLENIKSMSGTCTSVEQPREAMGMGDANWMACVGAFFGWKAVLFTILAGSVIGACVSMLMIVLRRREWAARIPFGPYLAAGAMIWLFFGPRLLEWYLSLGHGAAPDVS